MSVIHIYAINLGSTSTKVAYYEDDNCIYKETIDHSNVDMKQFNDVNDQFEFRKEAVVDNMREHDLDPSVINVYVSRGGMTKPLKDGVYRIDENMLRQTKSGKYGHHVCAVGCEIAYELAKENGKDCLALTVDTPSVDEMQPLARYSGLKEIERVSCVQVLNIKAMPRYYARTIGKRYEDLNLIVAMLGGGISVVTHRKGKMVDAPDGLEGEGPFSNNRAGTLPVGQVIKMCYSGKYSYEEMLRNINGKAGLMSYIGHSDIRKIVKAAEEGNTYYAEVMDAMCYQTAKEIGAAATVLKGEVDAILLIGGMANSEYITSRIKEAAGWIAPILILPGEREMESLCENAYAAAKDSSLIQPFPYNDL